MKNYFILLLFPLILFSNCKNDDDNSGVESLPEATQTGANTAGCLVNGKVLLPKSSGLGGPRLGSFYQSDGNGFYFSISFNNNEDEHLRTINTYIELTSELILGVYELKSLDVTNSYGEYFIGGGFIAQYSTNEVVNGTLTITYLDPQRQIVSGTFSYDAIDSSGNLVEIREGRFDVKYVR